MCVDYENLNSETVSQISHLKHTVYSNNFKAHVLLFVQLFTYTMQSISKNPQSSYSAAEITHNKLKNRFANIFPCKST